jgi:hypothetical protein
LDSAKYLAPDSVQPDPKHCQVVRSEFVVCRRSYPGEKRRKQTQATLTFLLEEADINDDLRIINKTLAQAKQPASPATQSAGKDRTVVPPHGFLVPGTRYRACNLVFRIRVHLIRIRIQGFDDQK